jgi:predicted cupin superfamily sugar epimerase
MMELPKRAQELIDQLGLLPHPEGGFYRETYRSESLLNGTERQLMTSIYFLLTGENYSRFHRITSDETWYFHEGNTLLVHTIDGETHTAHHLGLANEAGNQPFLIVKGGTIFGSEVKDREGYALVSCAVAPGFDFADFELFTAFDLLPRYPQHKEIILKMT